jgi:hypothetical protein
LTPNGRLEKQTFNGRLVRIDWRHPIGGSFPPLLPGRFAPYDQTFNPSAFVGKETCMRQAATKTAIAIITLVLLVPASGFELKFKTMTLPPNADVQVEGSTARIGGGRLGIETIWTCSCNKGEGSCSLQNSKGILACYKGPGNTCKSDCYLSMGIGADHP